jgi:hypothetical protein
MDYFDEALRDLRFLIRRRRSDIIVETLWSGRELALITLGLFSLGLYLGYVGDHIWYAMAVFAAGMLPFVVCTPLLTLVMPSHFGRQMSGTLVCIDNAPPWLGFINSSTIVLEVRELGREMSFGLGYGAKIEATVGRDYLILLHPRLERFALVLFDDDEPYMSFILRPLSRERRTEIRDRAAQLRDWPRTGFRSPPHAAFCGAGSATAAEA